MEGAFLYWAEFYNDTEEKEELESGITFAKSYVEAMRNVEIYYGEDLIKVTIEGLEPSTVCPFPEYDMAKKIEEEGAY